MDTAKLFECGGDQAVQLPEKCRFPGDEVLIQHVGRAVVLLPREEGWETFLAGLKSFTPDFMEEGRGTENPVHRDSL